MPGKPAGASPPSSPRADHRLSSNSCLKGFLGGSTRASEKISQVGKVGLPPLFWFLDDV